MNHGRNLQVLGLVLALGGTTRAQVIQLVSVTTSGGGANDESDSPTISADGRSVAFSTEASNLIGWDSNGLEDVYYRAWTNNYNEIVSVDSSALLANASSIQPSISGDGRFVVFASSASNLVPGDTNGTLDVIVRNRSIGTTQRVSVSSGGAQGNSASYSPSISPDGGYVVFTSNATNLVPGDTNGVADIFFRDRLGGMTERISVSSAGAEANGESNFASMSADGRYVVFASTATNLVPGDTNGVRDVFLRDRRNGTTQRISVSTAGVEGNGASDHASISADGLSVAFLSSASNLITWDTNGKPDVYYRAWANNYNEVVSCSTSSTLANDDSFDPRISADGRYVVFASRATNLVSGDSNQHMDVFVRARSIGTTERVSVAPGGQEANGDSNHPAISSDDRFVVFQSTATNLVSSDFNHFEDIFLVDRDPSGFTSLCLPGAGGVHACPCGNPPGTSGRGCDNSAHTGGALLSASGVAYLSADTLAFTTFSEKPTALSVVLQGKAVVAAGAVYGQGVRCVGGTLKRLYTKNATAGSISAPTASEPKVSARSAAIGDTIQAGQSRWYLVYYRDPVVLGGCPSASTFNTTQTGEVTWMP